MNARVTELFRSNKEVKGAASPAGKCGTGALHRSTGTSSRGSFPATGEEQYRPWPEMKSLFVPTSVLAHLTVCETVPNSLFPNCSQNYKFLRNREQVLRWEKDTRKSFMKTCPVKPETY